jgi:hypothetical protein
MSESAGKAFLNNPLLRMTPRGALNDPFECQPSKATKLAVMKLVGNEKIMDQATSIFDTHFHSDYDFHGVVALTESPDNLLMWSHYADEHRGIVVEFEVDEKKPYDLFNILKPSKGLNAEFGRVSYRKKRCYPYPITKESISDIRKYYCLSKSDEWIYEKEHRYFVPFSSAGLLIANMQHDGWHQSFADLGLSIPDISESKPPMIDLSFELNFERLYKVWLNSVETGAMFFLRVHPKNIGRVILGKNANIKEYLRIMRTQDETEPYRSYYSELRSCFNGIEVSTLNDDSYDLEFKPYKASPGDAP